MNNLVKAIIQSSEETGFYGVISAYNNETVIFNSPFGYRDIKNQLINETKTRFGIASGTKLFTALGIGVLIDQGMLSLNTKMKDIDINYHTFIDQDATILNLLTHTSGVYDYFDEEEIEDFDHFYVDIPWYQLETPLDYYPLFEGNNMKFQANKRFSYSNGGYVLLGIIIEKLTGFLYREFIEENVLKPANMRNSGFFAFNDLPENTANGYLGDSQTTNIYNVPIRGGGDGGMYTTTGDLRSFWDSLLSFRILSPNLTQEYLKTRHQFNDTIGYGCGIYKRLDDSMFFIIGEDAGVGFVSRFIVPDRLTINILSNKTGGAGQMSRAILNAIEDDS